MSSPAEDLASAHVGELQRYRSFIQLSDAAIWCFELDPPVPIEGDMDQEIARAVESGVLVECNESLARMYGYASAENMLGTPLSRFISLNPQNLDYLRAFWEANFRLEDGESAEVHLNGEPRSFTNNLIGIIEDGNLKQVWGTQRDITERKELEAQLLESQRMEAIGQLAGGIAHDFNNMLMVIAGNLGVVLEHAPLGAEDQDALQEALRAADRATDLTRQLLTFSRRTQVRREAIDLAETLRGVFRMLRRIVHENIRFELELDPSVPPVLANVGQIEQMLVNLTLNARDAMPEGGALSVSLGTEPGDLGRDWVVLRLSDTGIGMDAETRARIFEPFFTLKDRSTSTGLGLSVVYGVVRRCAGTIDVKSELGCGTTFVVRLPACREFVPERRVSAPPHAPAPLRTGTILLLEDRRDVLLLVRRFLESTGHCVLPAEHPDQAVALARSHPGPIDVLLCDVVMPGTNGAKFARELLEFSPRTRVILMSGYSDLPDQSREVGRGARFVAKPFSRAQLEEQVQLALAEEEPA